MDGNQLRDEAVRDRIRAATEFLDPTDPRAHSYRADILVMLNRNLRRLIVSIDEIRTHNRELVNGLLNQPLDYVLCFDEALKRIIATLSHHNAQDLSEDTVRPRHSFNGKMLTYADVLLCLLWKLWRERLQSTNAQLESPKSHGLIGGYSHKMLPCST